MAENSISSGNKVYLIDGRRTPFGKFGGSFKNTPTLELCLHASNALLNENQVSPSSIDQIIVGNVIPSTTETIYVSRHLGLKLNVPENRSAYNVNRLCGSGIQSILDAARLIRLGEANCVLAGGVENMSLIPHLSYGARFGTKYGPLKSVDMLLDTLTDKYTNEPMAITAENMAKKYKITREECEEFSYYSHKKSIDADSKGYLKKEIVPFETKKGIISVDEHVRNDISLENLKKLRPSFAKDGVVTAATASGIVDGAAFTLIASEKFIKDNNIAPLAEIVSWQTIGVDPRFMGIGPVPCIEKIMNNFSYTVDDIDLFEINEAFAAQVISCQKALKIPSDKLNVWGGAISRGHPLGATGSRISLTLARQLKEYNKKLGIASACIGGGQGIAILLESV